MWALQRIIGCEAHCSFSGLAMPNSSTSASRGVYGVLQHSRAAALGGICIKSDHDDNDDDDNESCDSESWVMSLCVMLFCVVCF